MIGLIDVDSKIPNLALMKISSYYKLLGEQIEFVREGHNYDKIYASSVFTASKPICRRLQQEYGSILSIGGTGWEPSKRLPPEIEACPADYNLYPVEMIANRIRVYGTRERRYQKAMELVNAGMGFSSRGCIRNCAFCLVPKAEGCFRPDQEIGSMINPRSNILILQDNNLTADPQCLDKLQEIKERKLVVDINQGFDIRLMTDEIAKALAEVRHLRSLHYAWDITADEKQVLRGIEILSRHIKRYRHMCYMLVGFNSSFVEDMYRFRRLTELKIDPYVMVYNDKPNPRLKCFERWVNSRKYKVCSFNEYEPWRKIKEGDSNYDRDQGKA